MIKEQGESMIIKAEGISKTYRISGGMRIEALKDASIEIPRGWSVLVNGPSGSGKSTLLNLIGCLDLPSRGRIIYDGEDLIGFGEEELCRIRQKKIGHVFQGFNLLPRMTAWENVSVGLVPLGIGEKERFRRASVCLERLGLNRHIYHRPEEMSGGEQQRVAVARAIINDPEIIMADEPTSNIDDASAREVLDVLADLKMKGRTIVIATHDTGLFMKRGLGVKPFEIDAIYNLEEGKILQGK